MRISQNFLQPVPDYMNILYLCWWEDLNATGWILQRWALYARNTHHIQWSPSGWERKAGCADCLWGAPNSGKLGWGCLSVGSQLHHITSPPEWAGMRLPLLILAAAVVFLHQHLPTLLAVAAEENLVSEKWKVQDLCWCWREAERRKEQSCCCQTQRLVPKDEVQAAALGWEGLASPQKAAPGASRPSPAAAVTLLSGVLVGRQGCSAAQEDLLLNLLLPGMGCWPDEVSLAGFGKLDHELAHMDNWTQGNFVCNS